MGNDILNKKYNFTMNSNDFLYSETLTKAMVDEIDEITNKRLIESSTYLNEKKTSKKISSKNKDDLKKNKKKSSIKSPDDKRSSSKKTRVEGGMWRGGPAGGPPAGGPPRRPDRRVNVNLRAQTPDEDTTFDPHNNPQNNLRILENAYAITYNHHQALPRDARPIGTDANFRTDSIVSASAMNGVNRSTQAEIANESITAVACAQWFDTIWRSVVRNEHTNHFATFNRGPNYSRRINLDGHGILVGNESIPRRVRRLAGELGGNIPPIAGMNPRHLNIVYSSSEFQDSNGNVYPEHRTYKILFIISRDIHFTFFCIRYDGGNIEFCSPHFTFQPHDLEDPTRRLRNYHLYASADGFLHGFNRNAVRNPIIALSILTHYISKTAYLLLFTDYARRPEDYGINPDYQTICRALVRHRPDRHDFVELGHYAGGLNLVIADHLERQFFEQDLSWFFVHHEQIAFYLAEYHHWLPQILVRRNLPALQRAEDGGPPRYWNDYHNTEFPRDHLAIVSGRELGYNYRRLRNENQEMYDYADYTRDGRAFYGDPIRDLPREPNQFPHPRWSDRFTGLGRALPVAAEAGMDFRPPPVAAVRRDAGPLRRPGDWICPRCNALVFASRSECFKCGAPRPPGAGRETREDRGPAKRGKRGGGASGNTRSGGAQLGISTNKTLIKYLNKEKELKIDIKLLKKDKNKHKKEIIKKTDLLKKLKLKIIDKKEKLKKQKQKEKEKLKKQKEKEKLKKTKRKRKT